MKQRDMIPFFAMTFFIAWSIIALYLAIPEVMARSVGALSGSHPLFYLAVYSPAISAVIMVGWRHGVVGVRLFLGRLLLFRTSWAWYVMLFVVVPAAFYVGAAIKSGSSAFDSLFSSVGVYLVALFLMAIKGPVEEIGWRGFALPLLQQRMAPIWAGLLVGMVWGIWHLPAFMISGVPQSGWSFGHFFVGVLALSLIVTPLFNSSRGSIFLAGLFHLQLMNPLWPDAQPYDSWLFVIVAGVVVWLNRETMFTNTSACREVVPS